MTVVRKVSQFDRSSKVKVELPDDVSDPLENVSQLGLLIYGQTGIGKSSLCRHFGKPFYFRFEPSSRWLQVRQSPVITQWSVALDYLKAAEENLKGYTTVVIDTAGPAFDRCLEGVCERINIPHPGKVKDYGASWKEVQKEFHRFHSRISSLNVGLIIVAHETKEDFESFDGRNVSSIIPHFSGWCMDFYKRWVDVIGYYFFLRDQRYLLIRGTDLVMAKCNVEDHFITTNGERVICIPMGNSSEEAYNNFMHAFDNRQEKSYEEILRLSGYISPERKKANAQVKDQNKGVAPLKKTLLIKKSV